MCEYSLSFWTMSQSNMRKAMSSDAFDFKKLHHITGFFDTGVMQYLDHHPSC